MATRIQQEVLEQSLARIQDWIHEAGGNEFFIDWTYFGSGNETPLVCAFKPLTNWSDLLNTRKSNAEEAVNHYMSIFPKSRILEVSRYGEAMPELKEKVLVMRFEIEGQELQALNGGPQFPFTEAISLSPGLGCETADLIQHVR